MKSKLKVRKESMIILHSRIRGIYQILKEELTSLISVVGQIKVTHPMATMS